MSIAMKVISFLMAGVLFFHYPFIWNTHYYSEKFEESVKELNNPNEGFYYIYGFRISDDKVDYDIVVDKSFNSNPSENLALIEINLDQYTDSSISEDGLRNLQGLFDSLSKKSCNYIVRFLYDWNGNNLLKEPQSIEIILTHIEQVAPIVNSYKNHIFTLQGLFVGNWGEMNGSIYLNTDSLKLLAQKASMEFSTDIYLGVRTPVQWRRITDSASESDLSPESQFKHRLGLYNDGILATYTDYGTYGEGDGTDYSEAWNRDLELTFQEELCRYVPNGGEIINENELNDLENTIDAFRTMHITYINRAYDQKIYTKWAATTIQNGSIYDGMDGLTYMERHLGYRFYLTDSRVNNHLWSQMINLQVDLKNSGFAPMYKPAKVRYTLVGENDVKTYELPFDSTVLTGGNQSDLTQTLNFNIRYQDLVENGYDVYFEIIDTDSNQVIEFANEQVLTEYGYRLGRITIRP